MITSKVYIPQMWISQRNERDIVVAIIATIQCLVRLMQYLRCNLNALLTEIVYHLLNLFVADCLRCYIRHVEKWG